MDTPRPTGAALVSLGVLPMPRLAACSAFALTSALGLATGALLTLAAACDSSASSASSSSASSSTATSSTTATTSDASSSTSTSASGGGAGGASGTGGAGGASGGGGEAASTTSTSTGAGGSGPSGDCHGSSDCAGAPCEAIVPGGFTVCVESYAEATRCTGSPLDECCTTTDCAAGQCRSWPVTPYCGGAFPQPHNECASDECATDADCPDGFACAAAGTVGNQVRTCIFAACHTDADCAAVAGGECAPVMAPCCQSRRLGCVYPGGCRDNADCPGGYCDLDASGRALCEQGGPICPG